MRRAVHDSNDVTTRTQRKRVASIVVVACLSVFGAGCALFGDEPAEPVQKPAVRKLAPVKAAVVVTPEQRAEAKALHTTALDQMGRGAFGPAASNLRRAAKLDPTNEQIRRDLIRADRIRSAFAAGEVPARHGMAD